MVVSIYRSKRGYRNLQTPQPHFWRRLSELLFGLWLVMALLPGEVKAREGRDLRLSGVFLGRGAKAGKFLGAAIRIVNPRQERSALVGNHLIYAGQPPKDGGDLQAYCLGALVESGVLTGGARWPSNYRQIFAFHPVEKRGSRGVLTILRRFSVKSLKSR